MERFNLPAMPGRDRGAHKGDFGKVLVLAGSPAMTGAAWLCAQAAVRGGAGLVTLGVPRAIHPMLASRAECWMTLPLPCGKEGRFSRAAAEPVLKFLESCDSFAIGPGIGPEKSTGHFARTVVLGAPAPGVVDADALNQFEGRIHELAGAAGPRVLTPHPGEFARLSGGTVASVQADREGNAAKLAALTRSVVVLKGSGTVVTDGRRLYVNSTGNPGMASGGTGDVLTGVICALLAAGLGPFHAAALGVNVHGRSGDMAAAAVGETSLCATDLLDHMGAAFVAAEIENGG